MFSDRSILYFAISYVPVVLVFGVFEHWKSKRSLGMVIKWPGGTR